MSTNGITIFRRTELSVAIEPGALTLREAALDKSALVAVVESPTDQEAAVAAQIELERVCKLVESQRKEVKAPVLELGRQIDATAEKFVADLKAEVVRVSRLVGDYVALEAAKARAAAEAARLEQERIERDRLKAEQDAAAKAAADARRLEEERQKALAAATTHEDLERAQAEADRKQRELQAAQQVEAARIAAEAAARQQAVKIPDAPVKADGQSVRTDWEITITDIHALYRAHPNAVKMEPRLSEIRQLLDMGVKVHGVRAEKVIKSGVRVGKERTIDV